MKILGISGTLIGSKTTVVTKALLKEIKNLHQEHEIELIDLKNYQLDFCDGRPLAEYNKDTQEIISNFEQADAYVLGTSIIHGSIPGALKNLLDLIPVPIFEKKPIVFAATGGNHLHYLAIENYLKPIASYLKMFAIPEYVFATPSDFNQQNELSNQVILDQLFTVAKTFDEVYSKQLV